MRSVPASDIENARTLRKPLDPQRQHRIRPAGIETDVEAVVDVPCLWSIDARYCAEMLALRFLHHAQTRTSDDSAVAWASVPEWAPDQAQPATRRVVPETSPKIRTVSLVHATPLAWWTLK